MLIQKFPRTGNKVEDKSRALDYDRRTKSDQDCPFNYLLGRTFVRLYAGWKGKIENALGEKVLPQLGVEPPTICL